MRQLLNAMRAQADMASGGRAAVRLGIVSSFDPGNYCAKVRIQPEDTETGWLPVVSPWVGNSWGLFAPPSIGDLVEVQFQEDDAEAGFVCQRFYNDSDRPLSVQSGEFWLVHKTGAFFKLTNDGKALINGNVEIDATAPTINITATGNVNVTASGAATVQSPSIVLKNAGSALRKLCNDLFVSLFNNHTHSGVQTGSGSTGTPNTTATVGTHTTNIVQAE